MVVTSGLVVVKKAGGILVYIAKGGFSLVKAVLGNLTSVKFWWELAKKFGEAIGIAFCGAWEEVFRKTGETLRGSASWYGQGRVQAAPASSSAFTRSNRNSSSGYWDREASYARPATAPATSGPHDSGNTIAFPGFGGR